jgi:hypothetical protein
VRLAHRVAGFALFALTATIALHRVIACGVRPTSVPVAVHSAIQPVNRRSPGGLATGRARPPSVQAASSGGSAVDEENASLVTGLGDPAITALTSQGNGRRGPARLRCRGRTPMPPGALAGSPGAPK